MTGGAETLPRRTAPRRPGERFGAWAGLVVVTAALYPGAVFGGRVLFARDLHLQWHTQVEGFVRAVAAGSWPVWNPWIGFGQPLWANANNQVLYPTTWLNLLLPPGPFLTVYVVLHSLLAGWGTVLLARRLGLSEGAAFLSAALFVASGPFASLSNLWNHLAGAAWIPWAMAAAHGVATAVDRPGRSWLRPAAAWGAAVAAPVLAGSLETALLAALASASLAACTRPAGPWRRLTTAAFLAAGLAVGLSAGQWLPTLDVARGSLRGDLPEAVRTFFSLEPALGLLSLLPVLPNDLPWRPEAREWLLQSRSPLLLSLHLGIPTLALAGLGLLAPGRRFRFLLAGLAGLALLVALGRHTPVYGWLTAALPLLRLLRYPVKALVLLALATALLAGVGLDAARRGRCRGLRLAAALLPCLVVSAAALTLAVSCSRGDAWLGRWLSAPDGALAAALLPTARLLAVCGALGLVTCGLVWRAPSGGSRVRLALVAGAVLALLRAHATLTPLAGPGFYGWKPPTLAAVADPAGSRVYAYEYFFAPGRSRHYLGRDRPWQLASIPAGLSYHEAEALALRTYLLPPTAGAWGVFGSYDIDLVDLSPAPLEELRQLLRATEETPAHRRLLRLGAVSRVVSLHDKGLEALTPVAALPGVFLEPIRVLALPSPLPRTFVVGGARLSDGADACRVLVDPSFDPLREVVLPPPGSPGGTAQGRPGESRPAPEGFRGGSRLTSFRPDRVELETESSHPGWAVLVDAHGAGWRARLDGQETPLLRANLAFRAVAVPAGRHRVEMLYRPPAVGRGLALTALAGLALAAAVVASRDHSAA